MIAKHSKNLARAVATSLLMLAGLPAGAAQAQSDQWNALYDRIIRLEHQVRSQSSASGGGGGGSVQIQRQLQQLSAQVNAMQQQMIEMQRELNRLRQLERQGLLFKRRNRVASVVSPQQQPSQWNNGQAAPNYGQMQQSVTIEGGQNLGAGSGAGQLPRGGLVHGSRQAGTVVLGGQQGAGAYQAPRQPVIGAQPQQPYQPQTLQPQPVQPQYQAAAPAQPVQRPVLPSHQVQPRQVQGVQSSTLAPPTGGGSAGGTVQPIAPAQTLQLGQLDGQLAGQPRYQLQQGAQYKQPEPVQEPSFDSSGRPSLAPEKVETALLDGSAGGNNLNAGTQGSALPQGVEAVDDAPGRLFLQAKSSYTSRDFNAAVSGFRTFTLKHKDHDLADDAQFMLGEAYYAKGSWKQAAQSYLSGYQRFPKSDKRGESLLKLAMSLNKLGQKKQACNTFAEVNKKFSKQAKVRNASIKEMQRAGCQ